MLRHSKAKSPAMVQETSSLCVSLSGYKLHDFSSPFFAHLLICFILSFPAYLFVSPLTGQKNGHLIAPESLLVLWFQPEAETRLSLNHKSEFPVGLNNPSRSPIVSLAEPTRILGSLYLRCNKADNYISQILFSVYSLARVGQLWHLHKI